MRVAIGKPFYIIRRLDDLEALITGGMGGSSIQKEYGGARSAHFPKPLAADRPQKCDYLHAKQYYFSYCVQYTIRSPPPGAVAQARSVLTETAAAGLPPSNGLLVSAGFGFLPMQRMQPADHPLRRKPLKDEVFDVLHEDILSGRYPAGAWLRQDEIAKRLGVSMTPVREALDLVVSAGLAERVAFRGVRVLRPTGPEILDAYEMRLLLEGVAAYAAAGNTSTDDLAGLRELLDDGDRLLALDDLPREREVSRALHMAIVKASGNSLLTRIYVDVLRAFPDWMLYEHLYRRPELLEGSIRSEHREHRLIVEALAEGNAAAAMSRTIEHIIERGRELETYLGIPREAVQEREARVELFLPQIESQIRIP